MFFPKFRGGNYASLFFWTIILIIAFAHAYSSPSLAQAQQLVGATIGESYVQYTGLILAIVETQLIIPYATLSFDPGIIALPPFWIYYLAAVVAGLLAGLIALKGERKFVDAFLSPIMISIHLLIGLFILTLVGGVLINSVQSALQNSPLPLPESVTGLLTNISVPPIAYILAFVFTYLAFAAGMLSGALIRHGFESVGKPAPPPSQPS